MIGRIIDVATNEGLEGVEVQLNSTGDIQFTDSEGRFRFINQKGFVVGEPNYSFVIRKPGYVPVSNLNNLAIYTSGVVSTLLMKKALDTSLWITLKDESTQRFLSNVTVNIKGEIKTSNKFGKVNYNFSEYKVKKVMASFIKGCYRNKNLEIDANGEVLIELVNICNDKKTSSFYNSLQILLNAVDGDFSYTGKDGESYLLNASFANGNGANRPNIENEIIESVREADILEKPIFTWDVALVMLLNRKLINQQEINWKKYTYAHIQQKKNVYKKNDLEHLELRSQFIFPGILPRKIPYYWIDYYRSWIVDNSKNEIDRITQIINYRDIVYNKTNVMLDYKISKIAPFKEADFNKFLQLKGLKRENVSFQLFKGLEDLACFVYSSPKKYIKTDIRNIAQPINEVDWKIEYQVDRIENTAYGDKTYMLFYISPVDLLYKGKKEKNWKKKTEITFKDEWEHEHIDLATVNLNESKSLFGIDVIIATLLHYKLIRPDNIKNWSYFARINFRNGSSDPTVSKDYRYPEIFSKNYSAKYGSIYSKIPNDGMTDYYKKWILTNSKSEIGSFFLPISRYKRTSDPKTGNDEIKLSVGNWVRLRYSKSSKIPPFKELDLEKVSLQSHVGRGLADFIYEDLFFVYPEKASTNYTIHVPSGAKIEPFDAYSKNWRFELKLNRVELDVINNKKYVFCYVVPEAVHYKTYDGQWHVQKSFVAIDKFR